MRRSMLLVAGTVVLALVSAGCGDDDESATQDDPTTTTTAHATESNDDTAEEPAPTVALADSTLGEILVDGEGRTLYLFDRDTPGTSTCTDQCLANWPPLEAPDELIAGDGVDESMLGTITRDDGTKQVTYHGLPLYYFAADSEPGDTNGQAVNDAWWVIGPDGEAIMKTATPAATGDGY